MQMLFCNIGWMKNYNGIDGDEIAHGGVAGAVGFVI
jgi:hypothetical protein